MTADQLRKADAAYKAAVHAAEVAREWRSELVRAALSSGWTHQQISDAMGLSRGRISQIAGKQ